MKLMNHDRLFLEESILWHIPRGEYRGMMYSARVSLLILASTAFKYMEVP